MAKRRTLCSVTPMELEGLRLQSAIYAGVTRRLIRECGIAPDRLRRAS